jgi:hypothetical protein
MHARGVPAPRARLRGGGFALGGCPSEQRSFCNERIRAGKARATTSRLKAVVLDLYQEVQKRLADWHRAVGPNTTGDALVSIPIV